MYKNRCYHSKYKNINDYKTEGKSLCCQPVAVYWLFSCTTVVMLQCILSLIKALLGEDFHFKSKWPLQLNVAGASPTLAPVQIEVMCRCSNIHVASEDGLTVTLNYRAEYLQRVV